MTKQDDVRMFIAEFKGVSVDSLDDSRPLGLSSLAAQRCRVGLQRKFGLFIAQSDLKTMTISALLEAAESMSDTAPAVTGQPRPTRPRPLRALPDGTPTALGIGIDIERVDAFRTSSDPKSDPFFQSIFTPAEFGYCLLQEDPGPHFAARFCAKEALRKCDSAYAALEFHQIQVSNHDDGSPYYEIPDWALELRDVSLSLSHTDEFAVAVAACR